MASKPLQDGVQPASKAPIASAPKKAFKRPCRSEKQAKKQARYELSKCKVSDVTISPVAAATTVGRHKAPRGGAAHIVTVTDDAQRTLQDGVRPASKAPNTLASKTAVESPCRVEQKAQEQPRYELLERKASHSVISPAEATTTVGRREASRGGAAHTVTVADDAQRTTSSSVPASPSNDRSMGSAADDAHQITPPSASAASSSRPNTEETVLTTAPDAPSYCHNCLRTETDKSGTLNLEAGVLSTSIRGVHTKLRHVVSHRNPPINECRHTLCRECHNFLVKVREPAMTQKEEKSMSNWENTWPSFLCNLLCGKDCVTNIPFAKTYHDGNEGSRYQALGATILWKFVPDTVREWYIPLIEGKRNDDIRICCNAIVDTSWFSACTKADPSSFFVDRGEELRAFHKDIGKRTLAGLLRQLRPKDLCSTNENTPSATTKKTSNERSIIMPDVLCPWGCTEFLHQAHACPHSFPIFVQHHLRDVTLNLPSAEYSNKLHLIETSRLDSLRMNNMEYPNALMWKNYPIRLTIGVSRSDGLVLYLCRHHSQTHSRRRLHLHVPEKPIHKLCSERPDGLAHAKLSPRMFRPLKASAFCTSPSMQTQQCGYTGSDSMNITIKGGFSRPSIIQDYDCSLAIQGRDDVNALVSSKVTDGSILASLAEDLRFRSQKLAKEVTSARAEVSGTERKTLQSEYGQGATYVTPANAMVLQKSPTKSVITATLMVHSRARRIEEEVTSSVCRPWLPIINYLMTEDCEKFGTPFRPVKSYAGRQGAATMMLWAVVSALSGCQELYCAVDQKNYPFRHDGVLGHLLAHVSGVYCPHANNSVVSGNVFKPTRSQQWLLACVEKCVPTSISDHEFTQNSTSEDGFSNDMPHHGWTAVDWQAYHKFNVDYWRKLFREEDCSSIAIRSDLSGGDAPVDVALVDVIVVIGDPICSGGGQHVIAGIEYETRVVLGMSHSPVGNPGPSKFRGVRYMRHAKHEKYYKQVRVIGASPLVTREWRYDSSEPPLYPDCGSDETLPTVTILVKSKTKAAERLRVDLLRSLGGQVHVFCSCSSEPHPLIVCGTYSRHKRGCMNAGCSDNEHYICSKPDCQTRICKSCFSKHLPSIDTFLDPPLDCCGLNQCSSVPCSVVGLDDSRSSHSSHGTSDSLLDSGEEITSNNECSEDSLGWSEEELSITSCNCAINLEDDFRAEADNRSNSFDLHSDFESNASDNNEANDNSDNEFSDSSACLRGPQKVREQTLLERTREIKEDWADQCGSHAFDVGRVVELRGFRDRVHLNGCHAILDSYDNISDHWVARLRGDTTKSVVVETCNLRRVIDDEFPLDEFCCDTQWNPMDEMCPTQTGKNDSDDEGDRARFSQALPGTNAGVTACAALRRGESVHEPYAFPCHVLFNLAGACLTRYNRRIEGTRAQQCFIQRLASTVLGLSMPLLYLMAACFPRHFYLQSSLHPGAVLGAPPISCYCGDANPHGFASTLQTARNLGTNAWSSTGNCPLFWSFCYDIQSNKASCGIDSRILGRSGFIVDVKSADGLASRSSGMSDLTESVDSHQAALDLGATAAFLEFDWFLTFTCNQAMHPGIEHLHKFKQSREWVNCISSGFFNYNDMSVNEKIEVDRSFEMAYGSVLGRCWMEVRKLWLENIIYNTSHEVGRVRPAFFRDEYQESSGNLAHMHGLFGVYRDEISDDEGDKNQPTTKLKDYITKCQACGVGDLVPMDRVKKWQDEGLLAGLDNWTHLSAVGKRVLSHNCSERCLRRVDDTGDPDQDYVCRKPHSVLGKIETNEQEWRPLPFTFSPQCLELLRKSGLYDEPTSEAPNGTFKSHLLEPKRHMGVVQANDTSNMSPVIKEYFAATRSMQNAQVISGTNGVSAYVVKYIVKLDQGNRVAVWADSHSGAILRGEETFLHNTKITGSKMNEDRAFKKSRDFTKPNGRKIAFTEMQQQLLGYPEVMTNLRFVRIQTKPFEQRSTTSVKLQRDGSVKRPTGNEVDSEATTPPSEKARRRKREEGVFDRFLTPSQMLLYRGRVQYDEVTQFSLRPVELLELCPKLCNYFRWFVITEKGDHMDTIVEELNDDVSSCAWYDALGRRVRLRKHALPELVTRLEGLAETDFKNCYSWDLRAKLLSLTTTSDFVDRKRFVDSEDCDELLPIPVCSNITPNTPAAFLLHLMLMLGEFETELDLRTQGTMRESLANAKLIGDDFMNSEAQKQYALQLTSRVIKEVFLVQPVTMRKLDKFAVQSYQLFLKVIVDDEIPVHDLPPCVLVEMLDTKDKELVAFANEKKLDQVRAVLNAMPGSLDLPSEDDLMKCTKFSPIENWCPIESFTQSENQSTESFEEQSFAVARAVRSVTKYAQQFGESTQVHTKNTILHGCPGSGKSHVGGYVCLAALAMGLRLMSTALMGTRANVLGGIHFHRLLCFPTGNIATPHRMAELAIQKLTRPSQAKFLYFVLTMDMLFFDEIGQLSAQQIDALDIILRTVRNTDIPFGGVHVFASMDHAQIKAIRGWPFLLSTHVLTDFVLIELENSVRAHSDRQFQRLQKMTRMSPRALLHDPNLKTEFDDLCRSVLSWETTWDAIDSSYQQIYPRRMPAFEAAQVFVDRCQTQFEDAGTEFEVSVATDTQRLASSRAEFSSVTSQSLVSAMNHGLKEPKKLLFFKGGQYFATVNGEGYNQSQLLLMDVLPTADTIVQKTGITLLAAPPGVNYIDIREGVPSRSDLERERWKKVTIDVSRDRTISHRGMMGKREQYSLKHTGSSTINAQMGNTITGKCAIGCSNDGAPWTKSQVVVMLSRTETGKDTTIVGSCSEAISIMWSLITRGDQWTDYIEMLLSRLTLRANINSANDAMIFDYAEAYPYRVSDIRMPSDKTGFVYFLVSVRDFDKDYIGQTECVARRLLEHNSGYGSTSTSDPFYRPYCVAAYITGLGALDKRGREELEQRWKYYRYDTIMSGNYSVDARIESGKRVVQEYNSTVLCDTDKIKLIVTIKRKTAGRVA